MSGIDWNVLLSIDGRQEEELRQFRSEQGWDHSDSPKTAEPGIASLKDNKNEKPISSTGVCHSSGTDLDGNTKWAGKPVLTAGISSQDSKWNAESLILEEQEETADETDLQLYQIRKKFTGVSHDDQLEQMLRSKQTPDAEWSADTPADLSVEQRYLRITKQLSGGQINDAAQKEMIFLSGTGSGADFGMKQFYSVFTVLQGSPSRGQISDVLKKTAYCSAANENNAGIRILSEAVREAVQRQDEFDAAQDKRYRSRQIRYNDAQDQAQIDYNAAKRKADRWRKPNE